MLYFLKIYLYICHIITIYERDDIFMRVARAMHKTGKIIVK